MITLEITKTFNSTKLFDELLTAKLITPTQSNGMSRLHGDTLYLDDDADLVAINAIINAHDSTPIPPPLSDIEKLRLEQAQANYELVQLIMMMGGA